MVRIAPIRAKKAKTPPRLRLADAALAVLFAFALVLGGPSIATGFPALLGSIIPSGLFAAEAKGQEPVNVVRLALVGGDAKSAFAPEVLFPVRTQDFPAWLAARRTVTQHTINNVNIIGPRRRIAVAIVLDDMGNDALEAKRAIALPRAVTLSFLPYPDATPTLARAAEHAGHQVIVHLPMQALGGADPGPMALHVSLSPDEIAWRTNWALSRVPGFAGVNNHMGSRFTEDEQSLVPVAEILADRHVFFLDSRTTRDSKVTEVAHMFGVASAGRDVFLDDVQTPAAVTQELSELELIARRNGVAIAIGHPHAVTLDVLKRWTASAASRGITLVPLDVAIRLKTERAVALAYNAQR